MRYQNTYSSTQSRIAKPRAPRDQKTRDQRTAGPRDQRTPGDLGTAACAIGNAVTNRSGSKIFFNAYQIILACYALVVT